MATDAQRRALNNYRKKSTKQIVLRFYPGEEEMYDFVKSQPNATAYVKGLIREDMERRGRE